jgi:2-enoyl-CoA hydratase-like protein
MPIDLDRALGAELAEERFSWSASEVQLYHLALGAGSDPVDPRELRYAHEDDLRVLPTFGVVAPTFRETRPPTVSLPGIELDPATVLHGSQEITVPAALPPAGQAVARGRIVDIQDKGSAAVIVRETSVSALDGTPLWTARSAIFARGADGFGGPRGSSERVAVPDRAPDAELRTPPCPNRHCGIGCAATATRCTPTRRLPPAPASTGRSCTDYAPGAWSPRP